MTKLLLVSIDPRILYMVRKRVTNGLIVSPNLDKDKSGMEHSRLWLLTTGATLVKFLTQCITLGLLDEHALTTPVLISLLGVSSLWNIALHTRWHSTVLAFPQHSSPVWEKRKRNWCVPHIVTRKRNWYVLQVLSLKQDCWKFSETLTF